MSNGIIIYSKNRPFGAAFLFLGHALANQFLYQPLNIVRALQELYDVIINAIPQIDLHLLHVLAVVFNGFLDMRSPLGFRQLLRHLRSTFFRAPSSAPIMVMMPSYSQSINFSSAEYTIFTPSPPPINPKAMPVCQDQHPLLQPDP